MVLDAGPQIQGQKDSLLLRILHKPESAEPWEKPDLWCFGPCLAACPEVWLISGELGLGG